MRIFAVLAVLCGVCLWGGAQTLRLKDGRAVSGTFVRGDANSIVFQSDDGVEQTYSLGEVHSIDFGLPTVGSADRAEREPVDLRLLPAGVTISVGVSGAIDSSQAAPGAAFAAVVEENVVNEAGGIVIPRGSPARLVLREVPGPGVALGLDSVRVNGRPYMVLQDEPAGARQRAGGAPLGALVSAIPGGNLPGAVQVLTRGQTVKVPSGTQLTFRVVQPLRLEYYR